MSHGSMRWAGVSVTSSQRTPSRCRAWPRGCWRPRRGRGRGCAACSGCADERSASRTEPVPVRAAARHDPAVVLAELVEIVSSVSLVGDAGEDQLGTEQGQEAVGRRAPARRAWLRSWRTRAAAAPGRRLRRRSAEARRSGRRSRPRRARTAPAPASWPAAWAR